MSADTSTGPAQGTRRPSRRLPARAVLWLLAAVVVAAMALDTTYRDADEPIAGARQAFDRDAFGRENYPKVAAEVEENAVELTTLLPALRKDADAASERYGRRQGSSPYNFPVRGEGVAGNAEGGLMPVEVRGAGGADVTIQIGPAINGTSLRDVSSFITFDQFVNQVDYADAATALNNEIKARVLADFDPAAAEGKRVTFTGAFTFLAPTAVTITPTAVEVIG